MVIVQVHEGASAAAVNVRITFAEELRFHMVMGRMERMILNGSVSSYSWYGRVMEFAEL